MDTLNSADAEITALNYVLGEILMRLPEHRQIIESVVGHIKRRAAKGGSDEFVHRLVELQISWENVLRAMDKDAGRPADDRERPGDATPGAGERGGDVLQFPGAGGREGARSRGLTGEHSDNTAS